MLQGVCLPWNQCCKVVLSIPCFLVVAKKLGFFWLLKSAIAALRASVLTMVGGLEEMAAKMVGCGRIP